LFAELAAVADEVYRASQEEEFRKAERGTNDPVESFGLAQAPPDPTGSKHGDNQCAAACTDHHFRLRRRVPGIIYFSIFSSKDEPEEQE
jgi:hypothetical protein